ncbi:MAG: tetratricopeptide repeat protein [Cognaticolwellia sp.]
MSVINQMLKDLDKRQHEQHNNASSAVPITSKTSVVKLTLIIITVLVILNIIGVLAWQLYSENQQLKSQVTTEHLATVTKENTSEAQVSIPVVTNEVAELTADSETVSEKLSVPISEREEKPIAKFIKPQAVTTNRLASNDEVSTVTPVTMPINNAIKIPAQQDQREKVEDKVEPEPKPSLTISRSQLSPEALAAAKISQAEQAMERNDIVKAESLFEEVLLVMPEHKTARKQLAALWYGKKSYQAAVNLLSQGIALAPQDQAMRIMSARIYYQQGQASQAYNILSPLKHNMNIELQALLANTAAELNEHEHALSAYKKLTTLEPGVGRWWLGSAVSLDSLGKFAPARAAYKQAIVRNNLSTSAREFARQRLIELGE